MERNSNYSNHSIRERGTGNGLVSRSGNDNNTETKTRSPSDLLLQWGNRKRSRCMKFLVKDRDTTAAAAAVTNLNNNNNNSSNQDPKPSGSELPQPAQRTNVRVDRRSSDRIKESAAQPNYSNGNGVNNVISNNGSLNLRQRPASPSPRILRNSESSAAMRGQSNGIRGLASPDRGGGGGGDRKGNHGGGHSNGGVKNHHNINHDHSNHPSNGNVNGSSSSDSKKGGGTSSGSDAMPAVWPPRFAIGLTTKEKEEDFLAIKGSKLPQRPKKRAKFIQRTLNAPKCKR